MAMITKTNLILICQEVLSNYFTERGTKATIGVMERLKLNDLKSFDEVPPDIVDLCILALFERVQFLKGNEISLQFAKDMKQNELFHNFDSLQDLLDLEKITGGL
jgi:hypothetical protein